MKQTRSRKEEGKRTARGSGSVTADRVPEANPYEVRIAKSSDVQHMPRMRFLLEEAQNSGAIVALRSIEYLEQGIRERRTIICMRGELLVGFAMAHPWQNDRYVSHSAMVVAPAFRGRGIAKRIKSKLIQLSRRRWPEAAIISLTLSPVVERMNKSLGFQPVPYCDLTRDEEFWKGCEGCVHHAHLKRNQLQDCHCWAGILAPPGKEMTKVIPKDALHRPENDSFYSPENGKKRP